MTYVSLAEVKDWLWLPVTTTKNLTNAVTTNPNGTVTRRALTLHGFSVGDSVTFAGVEAWQLGTHTIVVVSDANHFDVDTWVYTVQTPPWNSTETVYSDIYDSRLVSLIDYTKGILDDNIWDLTSQDWTETITRCDIQEYYYLLLKHINITALKSINWVTYSWVLNTDYRILDPQWRKLWINDLWNYVPTDTHFNIIYTAWFTTIPEKIKTAQLMLIESEFNKDGWKTIWSYTLWPRMVKYVTPEWEQLLKTVDGIINSYRKFNIYS